MGLCMKSVEGVLQEKNIKNGSFLIVFSFRDIQILQLYMFAVENKLLHFVKFSLIPADIGKA